MFFPSLQTLLIELKVFKINAFIIKFSASICCQHTLLFPCGEQLLTLKNIGLTNHVGLFLYCTWLNDFYYFSSGFFRMYLNNYNTMIWNISCHEKTKLLGFMTFIGFVALWCLSYYILGLSLFGVFRLVTFVTYRVCWSASYCFKVHCTVRGFYVLSTTLYMKCFPSSNLRYIPKHTHRLGFTATRKKGI